MSEPTEARNSNPLAAPGLESGSSEQVEETESYHAKLTPRQQKILQTVLGWIFGFAVWFCLALGAYYPDDVLMSWLFLAVFVGAMILRKQVEVRTGVSMRTFMRNFLISLIVFLALFVVLGPLTGILDFSPAD